MNNIQGWMGESELDWLTNASREMESVVEVGSWKGRSTYALLTGCKGTVYAVDHFQGDGNDSMNSRMARQEDVYEQFMENVGHFHNLRVMRMSSLEAAEILGPVDMVFIDANHYYESVKEDLRLWMPKARKLICGHDFITSKKYEGLRKAVLEMVGLVYVFQTIWYKEMRRWQRQYVENAQIATL